MILKIYISPDSFQPQHEIFYNVVFATSKRQAKPQISLRICAEWAEPLLVAWIFYEYLATDWTSLRVSRLKRRLHRLVWVYTCQNATLLKITCCSSFSLRPLSVSQKRLTERSLVSCQTMLEEYISASCRSNFIYSNLQIKQIVYLLVNYSSCC